MYLPRQSYDECKVVQEDELHLCFSYKGEIHISDRDLGNEAFSLLSEIYRKRYDLRPSRHSHVSSDLYRMDAAMWDRIKAIVEPERN